MKLLLSPPSGRSSVPFLTLASLILAGAVCSCSRLSVSTEIYAKDFSYVEDLATLIHKRLRNLDREANRAPKVEEQAREAIRPVFGKLTALAPSVFASDPDDFANSYVEATSAYAINAETKSIRALLQTTEDLGARVTDGIYDYKKFPRPDCRPISKDPNVLLASVFKLKKDYEALLRRINTNWQEGRDRAKRSIDGVAAVYTETLTDEVLKKANSPAPDAANPAFLLPPSPEDLTLAFLLMELEVGSGEEEIKDTTGVTEAAKKVQNKAREIANALKVELKEFDLSGEEMLTGPDIGMEGAEVLPLGDALTPRVVASSEEYWRGLYNRVLTYTWFGNSEIAVRMQSLGEFHVKGVIFDPSRITKATFDGVATAVKVAAAAYGVPLPVSSPDGSPNAGPGGEAASRGAVSKATMRAESNVLRKRMSSRLALEAKLFLQLSTELEKQDAEFGTTQYANDLKTLVEEQVKALEAMSVDTVKP
jgi:hypothetical protein